MTPVTYGDVGFIVHSPQETNKKYAIKCVKKKANNQEKSLKHQEKEFYVWREAAGHPNIISLYAAFETNRAYCFVMDYVKSGSLNRVLRKNRKIFIVLIELSLTEAARG